MADLTIRLKTAVDPSGAEQEIIKLKEKLEGKEINIKFNSEKMKTQMQELSKVLNDAFKLDKNQLSNLEKIQTTLKEINQLSKEVQKNLFGKGSTSTSTGNKELDNTIAKYKALASQSASLQKQMSKTINLDAYNALESKLRSVESEMKKTAKNIDELKNKCNVDISRDLINSFDKVQQKARTMSEQINNMFKNKNLTSSQVEELQKLQTAINNVKGANLDKLLSSKNAYLDMHNLNAEIKDTEVSLKALNGSITFTNKVDASIAKLDSLQSKLTQLGSSKFADNTGIQKAIQEVEKLKADLRQLDPNTENAKAEFDTLKQSIVNCENEYKRLETEVNTARANVKFTADFKKVEQDLKNLADRCKELGVSSEKIDEFRQRLQSISNITNLKDRDAELKALIKDMSTFSSSLPKKTSTATNSVNETTKAMTKLGTATKKTNGFASNLYSTLKMYSLGNLIARSLTTAISGIKNTIVETDTAIKKVLKVAPKSFTGTEEQLDWLTKKATEAGQEVARSSIDIINSTANALQSGFHNVSKAVEYAKNSAMFANVIDVDQEKADKYLKSTLASFGGISKALDPITTKVKGATKEYSNMMQMMDLVNYANNNYAVTGADVAEASSRSASVAKTLGLDMKELFAIIVAGQEPLQNASKVGTGIKTILQNLTGLKTSAKDGSISMNKTALAIEKIAGIKMKDANGQMRDTFEILSDIGEIWDTLSKDNKSALAEAIAGKHQLNVFTAMMNNWEQAKKYLNEVNNGDAVGVSLREKQHSPYVEKSA